LTKLPKSVINTKKFKTVQQYFFVTPCEEVFALRVVIACAKAYRAAHVAGRVAVAAD
jgi:hypothetical protein